MAKDLDRHLDEFYGAPLSEFTQARDRLASQLRDAGRQAEAAEIKRRRKPSAPLWTVNQLARRDPASLGRFIDSVNRLKQAHLKGAGEVGQATTSQRAALAALLDRAEGLMDAAGMKASPAMLQRISSTLLGAAADRQLQTDLRRGRLDAEQNAPGFEVLTGAPLRAVPAAVKSVARDSEPPKAKHEDQASAAQARKAEAAKAREMTRQARHLEQTAARHRQAADAATARAEKLGRQLQALQQKAAEERAAAEAAERQAHDFLSASMPSATSALSRRTTTRRPG
jgi:hypothetical protein